MLLLLSLAVREREERLSPRGSCTGLGFDDEEDILDIYMKNESKSIVLSFSRGGGEGTGREKK